MYWAIFCLIIGVGFLVDAAFARAKGESGAIPAFLIGAVIVPSAIVYIMANGAGA